MVRQHQVDLDAVRAFLAGAPLPLRGTDPMGSGVPRIFSAAMFPARPGDVRPPGYLYVVLDSQARERVAAQVRHRPAAGGGAALAAAIGLLVTLALGAVHLPPADPAAAPAGRVGLRDYSRAAPRASAGRRPADGAAARRCTARRRGAGPRRRLRRHDRGASSRRPRASSARWPTTAR